MSTTMAGNDGIRCFIRYCLGNDFNLGLCCEHIVMSTIDRNMSQWHLVSAVDYIRYAIDDVNCGKRVDTKTILSDMSRSDFYIDSKLSIGLVVALEHIVMSARASPIKAKMHLVAAKNAVSMELDTGFGEK